uniref:(northern house mosquito) hypothetical protein n=1 Tax=Culex pipiens TaxID=7175 RepID=A0A8D8B769_CULPI
MLVLAGRGLFFAVVHPDYAVYLTFVHYQLVDEAVFERYVLALDDDGVLLLVYGVVFVDGGGCDVIFEEGWWWRGFLDASVPGWTVFSGVLNNGFVVFVTIRGWVFTIDDFDVIISFAGELLTFQRLFGSMAGIGLVRGRFVCLIDVMVMMVRLQWR